MRTVLAALSLFAVSCATAPAATNRCAPDLSTSRVVDLTHTLDDRTLFWPTSETQFRLERQAFGQTPGGYFYASNAFCTPEHGGTHLDAPIHFGEGKMTAEQVPLSSLIAPAVVIDISREAAADPDYRLTREDVRQWEARNARIPHGSAVLLRTGWSARWPDRKRYFGDDTPGDASKLHFPSFGEDAVTELVQGRNVVALGVDTASIDYGASKDFKVHRIAAAANVPGFENLTGLDALPETGAWIVALPVKIGGGSGGPLRAVAVIPSCASK